jgi:cysteine desulfurase/selenocysteine lyase
MIYLDNAATSWPKPPEVLQAMSDVLVRAGGNPGRSGHRLSISAARVVYDAREEISRLFNCPDPVRVIFLSNATHAINQALYGLLKPGDRVVTGSMEHNAVMRPLRDLKKKSVNLQIVPCTADGTLKINDFDKAITPGTRLVVITHASNVTGKIMPVAKIAQMAHRVGALLLVDAAQTAGVLPIDMKAMGIDLLAFTGHKGLQGPPGIGGLVINKSVNTAQIAPLIRGGTGSQSDKEEQPEFLPDKYESGTPNIVGIAGLHAGIRYLLKDGIESIRMQEMGLTRIIIEGLSNIPGVQVHGTRDPLKSVAIVSFTVENRHVSEIGQRLDEEHGVLTRVGLHCAPAAHKTIGTYPGGTVRLAPGVTTSLEDIHAALSAIEKVVKS